MAPKSSKSKEPSSYEPRDVVLGKVRGYPSWPGMVIEEDVLPPDVLKERPTGKKATFYCVKFFPTGDHAWLVAKDMSKLQKHEIEAYISEPHKKSGDLMTGYRIALDPTKWEEEIAARMADAVEAQMNAEVDELEDEVDEDAPKVEIQKPKKRKRDNDGPKKAKKEGAAKEGKKKGGTKIKANGATSKMTVVESEDEAEAGEGTKADAGPSEGESAPPPKKAKRDKEEEEVDPELLNDPEAGKVRDWRHKLQKAFLSTKTPLKDHDMDAIDQLLTTVESYDKMTVKYLTFSKIGKVMKHIIALPEDRIPRDSEFKFRQRAAALVEVWQGVVESAKSADATAMQVDAKTEAAPAVAAAVEAAVETGAAVAAPATEAPAANGTGEAMATEA